MIEGEQDNPLQASDDDFLNMVPPSAPPKEEPTEEEKAAQAAAQDDGDHSGAGIVFGDPDDQTGDDDGDKTSVVIPPVADEDGEAAKDDKTGDDKPASGATGAEGAKTDPVGSKSDDTPGADRVFQIPVKFKANGKDIELRSEAEALSLMQMGANYTKKMQELQPHRKVLMMLQNNKLDESELSFLIDVKNGDPEAIKKLIKDSGIDPLEIDTNAEPTYVPGSHLVTDEEAGFRTVLEDLRSTPDGQATLDAVNTWDQPSKQVVWKTPEILTVLHQQRESGIYADIAAEVDRRMTLGTLPANTPFLQAYQTVGDEMAKAAIAANGGGEPGAGADSGAAVPPNGVKTPAEPVATRAAAPKPKLANGDQAAAAASTRASPAAVKAKPDNPLAMSDEAFLKSMEGRV